MLASCYVQLQQQLRERDHMILKYSVPEMVYRIGEYGVKGPPIERASTSENIYAPQPSTVSFLSTICSEYGAVGLDNERARQTQFEIPR